MKKIIDGKVYNTETATLLGEWDNGYMGNDFNFAAEDLYITKKGQYFLHCQGGANSSYSEACGNSRAYGHQFILLDEDEAKEWAENKLTADEVITLFGEVEEG